LKKEKAKENIFTASILKGSLKRKYSALIVWTLDMCHEDIEITSVKVSLQAHLNCHKIYVQQEVQSTVIGNPPELI